MTSPENQDAGPLPGPPAGSSAFGIIVRRHGDHVVEVVLDRPQALNAISTALAGQLTATMHGLALDRSVRTLVLTSSNERAFCVGADLKERAGFSDDDLLAQRPVIRALFESVRDFPMPAIAAVNGFALGGGFELALSCDVIVSDQTAVVGLTEVTVGLVPGGGGTQLLARRIGAGRAAEMLLTGRKVDAQEAFRLGIIDRIAVGWPVRELALDLASMLAANAPLAVRYAKQALGAALGTSLAGGLDIEDAAWRAAAVSADRREGISAFAEKRPPRWSGT
jgi:enoyl-CoA hydratase/carnithine racemase